MRYVFDSGPLINLKFYYSSVFTTFWDNFNLLILNNEIISPREVYNEISYRGDFVSQWADNNKNIFKDPTLEEINVVRRILNEHKELIKIGNITGGKPVADPFVIAQGYCRGLIVVSTEYYTPNAHKVPNICSKLSVQHMNFSEFMENEGRSF